MHCPTLALFLLLMVEVGEFVNVLVKRNTFWFVFAESRLTTPMSKNKTSPTFWFHYFIFCMPGNNNYIQLQIRCR